MIRCGKEDKNVEFIWRKDLKKEQYNTISDYIIIVDAPKDSLKLKQFIDNFNDTTNIEDNIVENKTYFRFFYKESKETPVNFQEYDDVLGGHRIDDNHKDLLFIYNWRIYNDSLNSYHFYYKK
jgi:hypothetical protein